MVKVDTCRLVRFDSGIIRPWDKSYSTSKKRSASRMFSPVPV